MSVENFLQVESVVRLRSYILQGMIKMLELPLVYLSSCEWEIFFVLLSIFCQIISLFSFSRVYSLGIVCYREYGSVFLLSQHLNICKLYLSDKSKLLFIKHCIRVIRSLFYMDYLIRFGFILIGNTCWYCFLKYLFIF